ncbi:MAG: hypothetical protein ACP5I4_00240 [Oceanipulchritudo sp.]
MSFDTLNQALKHLLEPPYLYFAAVAVVLLVALYIAYTCRRANQGIVPFKTQGGSIEIAPHTLRGVIQQAANSIEGVERASCRHFMKGRNLGVKVAIHLRANSRLKDVEARIKRCIQATLYEQFGMENVDPIHIRVTRMIGDPVAVTSMRKREEDAEIQSMTGLEDDDSGDERPYADETRI